MSLTRALATAGLAVALSITLACTTSRDIPRADHMHGPLPHQQLRSPDYDRITFWAPLDNEVYERVRVSDGEIMAFGGPLVLTRDQELIVHEFGPPEYGRRFRSLEGERVLEWLLIDQNLMCQFVEGTLVYQGEIRDLEHTLLRHGAPAEVMYNVHSLGGNERVTFIYSKSLEPDSQYYSFSNGQLVYEDRHR
jgi:hypothetical protein